MSFDQGAWDQITALQNAQDRIAPSVAELLARQDEQIEELQERLDVLEQRFRDLKKAVWRA